MKTTRLCGSSGQDSTKEGWLRDYVLAGNLNVDPAIWFIGESRKPEWVVVRASRFLEEEAVRPSIWPDIAARGSPIGKICHFAPVVVVSADELSNFESDEPAPLYRGHAMHVEYGGLK